MKLRTVPDYIRLGLGVISKRLTVATSGASLAVAVMGKRLSVAVGKFLARIGLGDLIIAQSSTAFFVSKPLPIDQITVADDALVQAGKEAYDNVGIGDGERYFAEDYVEGAPSEQTYTLAGLFVLVPSKVLSDTAAAVSAGSFLLQGYVDSDTYFAEDYVGYSGTFS